MTGTDTQANAIELALHCVSWQEAQKIADHLLEQGLVGCAHFLPVLHKDWREGELESVKEVVLLMESVQHRLQEVRSHIAKLHSLKDFVLHTESLNEISDETRKWLQASWAPKEMNGLR